MAQRAAFDQLHPEDDLECESSGAMCFPAADVDLVAPILRPVRR
jgi:hypothetical protein